MQLQSVDRQHGQVEIINTNALCFNTLLCQDCRLQAIGVMGLSGAPCM